MLTVLVAAAIGGLIASTLWLIFVNVLLPRGYQRWRHWLDSE